MVDEDRANRLFGQISDLIKELSTPYSDFIAYTIPMDASDWIPLANMSGMGEYVKTKYDEPAKSHFKGNSEYPTMVLRFLKEVFAKDQGSAIRLAYALALRIKKFVNLREPDEINEKWILYDIVQDLLQRQIDFFMMYPDEARTRSNQVKSFHTKYGSNLALKDFNAALDDLEQGADLQCVTRLRDMFEKAFRDICKHHQFSVVNQTTIESLKANGVLNDKETQIIKKYKGFLDYLVHNGHPTNIQTQLAFDLTFSVYGFLSLQLGTKFPTP